MLVCCTVPCTDFTLPSTHACMHAAQFQPSQSDGPAPLSTLLSCMLLVSHDAPGDIFPPPLIIHREINVLRGFICGSDQSMQVRLCLWLIRSDDSDPYQLSLRLWWPALSGVAPMSVGISQATGRRRQGQLHWP